MITIYAHMKEEVEKKLNSLKKKAKTYGLHFDFEMGEEHPEMVNIYRNDPITHTSYIVAKHVVNAIDVDINSNIIKANGWNILAKIEHGDNGYNVVSTFEGQAQESWYTLPPKCDHCKVNRYRKITFLVQHENGEIRQVGDTCLKDYTGINPNFAIAWAKIKDLTEMNCNENSWDSHKTDIVYSVVDTIANAIDAINTFGYVKSSECRSTKNRLIELMKNNKKPSEKALKESQAIINWLDNMDYYSAGELESNCKTIVKSAYTKTRFFGYLAYLPIAYRKHLEYQTKKEKERQYGGYVGQVGEKITINTVSAEVVSSYENSFGGYTYIYRFKDIDNHIYVWFTSSQLTLKDKMTVKGTIKQHNDFNGQKQTVLTRCKVS